MTTGQFMERHGASPEQIPARECLEELLHQMDEGLAGRGPIPMLPSYLTTPIRIPEGAVCCVLDAGGTNLRTARAVHGTDGWRLEGLKKAPMPGTQGELSMEAFYDALAEPVRGLGDFERVGFCFSYNVSLDRALDGTLDFWCKEVRVPEAVGKSVGGSLQRALGAKCESVRVLNDSVAAMLGAGDVQVGVILGTGVNVCYREKCGRIPKAPADLKSETMIISTEVGEFTGIPGSSFEARVLAASDAPGSAVAEKQCSGGYLGAVIGACWRTAAAEGLLRAAPEAELADISRRLGEGAGGTEWDLARIAIARAAKIAAILCAGPILRSVEPGQTARVAVEGSQYWRLTGFREAFHRELTALLAPEQVGFEVVRAENACLLGAALAAFADPM